MSSREDHVNTSVPQSDAYTRRTRPAFIAALGVAAVLSFTLGVGLGWLPMPPAWLLTFVGAGAGAAIGASFVGRVRSDSDTSPAPQNDFGPAVPSARMEAVSTRVRRLGEVSARHRKLGALDSGAVDVSKTEMLYRKLFDRVCDAIFIHDQETHRFLDWNATVLTRYGYGPAQLRNMTPFDLHPPDELSRVEERISERNIDRPYTYHHVTRAGYAFPVEILSEEIEYAGRQAWLSIVRDISERKRAESALKAAKDLAEKSNQAKSEFLANVSHEIRSPLAGAVGMAQLLLETELDENQHEFVETIVNCGATLGTLLDDIIDMSRIEAGKLELVHVEFDLESVEEEVAHLLAVRAEEKSIDFCFRYDPNAPKRFLGDPGRLRQILINLVGNAIKFTSKGDVFINIEAEKVGATSAMMVLSVEDTGMGIPQDQLDRVFERYEQVGKENHVSAGGSGLGLSICRKLAGLMRGKLEAQSVVQQGSTFKMRVPLELAAARESEPQPRLDQDTRVLLAVESPRRRELLCEVFEHWGATCHVSESHEDTEARLAEARAADEPYNVAVISVEAGSSRDEALWARLRQNPALRDQPLLVVRPMGTAGNRAALELEDDPATVTLLRPVRVTQLHTALKKLHDRPSLVSSTPT